MGLTTAQDIEQRTTALCNTINTALAAHYKKVQNAATKVPAGAKLPNPAMKVKQPPQPMKAAKAAKAAVKQIEVKLATGQVAKARTPAEQAALILKGTSWTCNSAHMSDGARHVNVYFGGNLTWDLNGIKKTDAAAYKVFSTAFQQGMTAQKLRNFSGGAQALPAGDALHVELPNSRLQDTDAKVTQCLETYAKATRVDGKAKNAAYETTKGSAYQKTWLKNYDAKLAKQKALKAVKKGPNIKK